MNINILNNSKIDVIENELTKFAHFVIKKMYLHPESELSIILFDNKIMSDLHRKWMVLDESTDVMSFPINELKFRRNIYTPTMLGDIILCPDFARKQAIKNCKSLNQELILLITHGILHIIGYDHLNNKEKEKMFNLQNQILKIWVLDRNLL